MSIIQAIILGIVQGLTEFLPISSTAHLTITGKLMGLISAEHPEQWTAFMAVIQLGTVVAVLWYFRTDLVGILRAFIQETLRERKPLAQQSLEGKMAWFVAIGTVPIVTIGLALKKIIEGNLTKDLSVIAFSMIGLAIILFLVERIAKFNREIADLTWRDALIIGLAQTLALIPGSSRSGTTITAGLFLGMNRESAARFSFLLSIPAVLASGLQQFVKSLPTMTSGAGIPLGATLIATVISGVSGYIAIAFLLKFLRTHSMISFVLYRILVGALLFFLLGKGLIA